MMLYYLSGREVICLNKKGVNLISSGTTAPTTLTSRVSDVPHN